MSARIRGELRSSACYARGPAGLIVELAEPLDGAPR